MRAPALVGIALALAACGGDQRSRSGAESETAAAHEPEVPPDPLWSYAPRDWIAAVVVRDGSIAEIDKTLDEIRRIVSDVGSSSVLDRIRELIAAPAPIDPLDPSTWASVGVDVSRGLAIFVGADLGITVAVSVSDRAELRRRLGGDASGDGDLFDIGYCAPARGRYLCAADSGRWKEVASGTGADKSLASDVAIELRPPEGADDLTSLLVAELAPMGVRAVSATSDLQNGRLIGRVVVEAQPPRGWLEARRRTAPRELTEVDKSSAGFLRLRLPATNLRSLPWPSFGPIDLRELLPPELTGDIALVASGQTPLGVHTVIGLRNGGPIKIALRAACRLARFGGFGSLAWRNERCEGKLSLGKLGLPRPLLAWLPRKVQTYVQVRSSSAVVSMMAPPVPGSPIYLASGPVAQNLHSTDWNIAAWGRWTDPELVLTGDQAQALRSHLDQLGAPREVAAARALLAHIYDAGIGIRATTSGFIVEGSVTTFADDDAPVYRAYSIAAIELGRGNLPGYIQGIATIAKKYPRSLAARQATARGLALVPLAGLGVFLEQLGIQ